MWLFSIFTSENIIIEIWQIMSESGMHADKDKKPNNKYNTA